MTPKTFVELRDEMWHLRDGLKAGLSPELAARRLETLVDGLAWAQLDPERASHDAERARAARSLAWRAATAYERAQVVGHLRYIGRLAGPLSPVREAMERVASAIDAGDHSTEMQWPPGGDK
jgi:hypothetical protein